MTRRIFVLLMAFTFSAIALNAHLYAAGSSSDSNNNRKQETYNFSQGKKAVDSENYSSAIQFLLKAAGETPKNADVYNLLGYSYRKLGNYDQSFTFYNKALSINPNHRGANEYIGELYLQTGNLSGAEKHLEILDKSCWFGCEEYDDLKEEIANYKANH